MTIPIRQQGYAVASGSALIPTYVFEARDPTSSDTTPNYSLYTVWVNTQTFALWYLEAFLASNGVITSQWRAVGPIVVKDIDPTTADYLYPLGQTWIDTSDDDYWVLVDVTGQVATWVKLTTGGGSTVDTLTGDSGGAVSPDASNNINLLGTAGQITTVGDPGTNTITWSLTATGTPITQIDVDAHTGPGTEPVVATAAGLITVTGGQVAAGTTANVIQTNSLAANTYTVQIQRSQAVASTTVGDNGVCHFSNVDFTVDSNGFVELVGGAAITSVVRQVFTMNDTYTPTSGMVYCDIEVLGGGGAGGGSSSGVTTYNMASGGGGGEYAKGIFSAATIGVSQAVSIGAGGTGISGSTGNSGGTTSVGALITAVGGSGGIPTGASAGSTGSPGGAGGTGGTGGDIRTPGSNGGFTFFVQPGASTFLRIGGAGANSQYGSGGLIITQVANASNTNGNDATGGYGAGGGGGVGGIASTTGGAGSAGVVIITEYIS